MYLEFFFLTPLNKPIAQCQACFIDLIIIYLFYLFTYYKLIFKDFRMLYIIRKGFYR